MPSFLPAVFRLLLMAVALTGTHWLFFEFGAEQGKLSERAATAQRDRQAMESVVTRIDKLAADANTASLALSKTISDRIVADAKTTKDIRDALKTTAHLRADCVLPDSVVRDLAAARHRANTAAAAGLDNAVPTAAGAN